MGAILGSLLVFFLLGKMLEIVLLKRIIKSPIRMFFVSSYSLFIAIFALWIVERDEPHAQNLMIIDLFIGALLLPVIRRFLHKRKLRKAALNPQNTTT